MSVHHERILSSMLRSLETGCPVVTSDGEVVGTLAEVVGEAIKVDAPMRRDFWIDADYVRSCEGGRVELSFLKQDLGAYKMSAPVESAPDATRKTSPSNDPGDRVDVTRPAGIAFPNLQSSEAEISGMPAKAATDPLVQGKADHIISEEEQIETRLRMERELAAQRQELPHLHPRGEEGPPDTFGTLGEPVEAELSRYGVDADLGSRHVVDAPSRRGMAYGRFLAVAAAVIPFVAAVWWMRRR